MAACTNLAVTIHGNGGHGSMPAQTVDPVVIAAHVVTRLQTVVAREVPPEETVVVTVGKLHTPEVENVVLPQLCNFLEGNLQERQRAHVVSAQRGES